MARFDEIIVETDLKSIERAALFQMAFTNASKYDKDIVVAI